KVMNAVDCVDQDRPRHCVAHQYDLHLQPDAEYEYREREERDGWNWSHEVDDRRYGPEGEVGRAERNSQRDRYEDRYKQRFQPYEEGGCDVCKKRVIAEKTRNAVGHGRGVWKVFGRNDFDSRYPFRERKDREGTR